MVNDTIRNQNRILSKLFYFIIFALVVGIQMCYSQFKQNYFFIRQLRRFNIGIKYIFEKF